MVKRNLLDQRDNPQLLKLWEDYQADDKLEARNALVEHYRPFAAMVARKLKTKLPRSGIMEI